MPDTYYDAIASGYDALHGEEQDAKLQEFLVRIDLKPHMTLLDVGCGTGRSARLLDVQWHGIEPSAGLIAHADSAARPRILQGSGESLPFAEASFDVILSLTALQNFTDPAKGIAEMLRVCKPNGLLLLSVLKKSAKSSHIDRVVRETLSVAEAWENEKDLMYFCQKRP